MKRFFFIFFLLITYHLPLTAYAKDTPVIRPKIGLAFGGGGARGAAHIGILRVLERENIPVDYLVGTSAGALIAALYAGGIPPDELEKHVLSGIIKKVYKTDISILRVLLINSNRFLKTILGKPFYAGLYNDHKLHNFINKIISKTDGSINVSIPLNIIAVDLITGLPVVIKSGDVGLAVQASTAIPTIRQPIQIDDKLLIDGGVLENIPVDEVKKMGADIVIAIDVDSKMEKADLRDFRSFESVITRVINLGLKAQSLRSIDKADIVINPELTGINILDLDKESLIRAIKAGEEAMQEKIPEIKKRLKQKTNEMRLVEKAI